MAYDTTARYNTPGYKKYPPLNQILHDKPPRVIEQNIVCASCGGNTLHSLERAVKKNIPSVNPQLIDLQLDGCPQPKPKQNRNRNRTALTY
jgi:hypothetical protein